MKVILLVALSYAFTAGDCCNILERPNQPQNSIIVCHTRQSNVLEMYTSHLILVCTKIVHGSIFAKLGTRYFCQYCLSAYQKGVN